MKTSFWKKALALLLALLTFVSVMTVSIGAAEAEPAAENQGIEVRIESVMRGYEKDMNLRSSELLVANVIGYEGNPQELTYVWTNTLGTYLYVYNSRNMYYINNTDGEIEIYNDSVPASTNMTSSGRSYPDEFSGVGYCWAAIYGSNTSGAQTSIADKNAYNGTISVTVIDKNGNKLGSASHTGEVTTTGMFFWEKTTYDGIVPHDLQADMDDVTIGIFEGDKRNVKDLLGESAILHITCSESTVREGEIKSGNEYINLEGNAQTDYYVYGKTAGSSVSETGDAQIYLEIQKGNCKFHSESTAKATTTVYVFKKPTTATTAHTLTLTGDIDQRCTYYINGKEGDIVKNDKGEVVSVTFTGLTPNTSYQVEVRGKYTDNGQTRYAYAYVYDTTKPIYTGTVEVYLDGTYDSATHTATGTPVNLNEVSDYSTIYAKEVNGTEFIELKQKVDADGKPIIGTYSSILDEGSYHLYYEAKDASQIDNQLMVMHNADRVRYLFYNSVTYYDVENIESETDKKEYVYKKEYYVSESSVNTIAEVPTKDGYVFTGWELKGAPASSAYFSASSLLTDHISGPMELVATWEKGVNVYVNFEIDHTDGSGNNTGEPGCHNIVFDLMSRPISSSGDYVDVFDKSMEIIWDGTSDFNSMPGTESENRLANEFFNATVENNHTYYNADKPILSNVLRDNQYTVEVLKPGYEIESVKVEEDNNENVIIKVKLKYEPKNGDLKFKVKIDEASKNILKNHPEYMPAAVNVKVLSWYTSPRTVHGHTLPAKQWNHITQHHDTYVTLHLKDEGEEIFAVGSYPVWMHNSGVTEYYYYRIKVVSYVLPDGTVLGVEDVVDEDDHKDIQYISTHGRYTATINVTNGDKPSESYLEGAHFNTPDKSQMGDIVAEIHINTYNVTFDPEGGKFSDGTTDDKTVKEQIVVPDLSEYTPTRDGGYVFDGWHTKDENGELVKATVNSGDELLKDIELFAAWKAPLTVKGDVFVAGYYYMDTENTEVAIIPKTERTHAVTVYLQKLLANNYAETVATQQVVVTYDDIDTVNVDKPFGKASYSFTQVPDDGHRYRILIHNPNYIVSYQNEPDSVTEDLIKDFNKYNEINFEANFEYELVNEAVVNAFMRFDPHEFDLRYKVIANSIGKGFRPTDTDILVRFDDGQNGPNPQSWAVISQMISEGAQSNGFNTDGISQATYDGIVTDMIKYPVWITKTDGHSLYDYSVSLDSYTINGTQAKFDAAGAPFYVSYNGSARYSALEGLTPEHQSQLLTVELIPKRYTVTFNPGFEETTEDYITEFGYRVALGKYETGHIWSFKTELDEEPTRPGYKFTGWIDKYENEVTEIDASVAENVTLTATWEKLFTVTFHTNNDAVNSRGIYRVYYENGHAPQGAQYMLTEDGKVAETYDLPALTDAENNLYIFKGWYLDPVDEDEPISWDTKYTEHTDVYAHWIKIESVAQDASDTKKIPYPDAMYPEYDLSGVQIRKEKKDTGHHYGQEAPGLRFVAVLSERVYDELNYINTFDGQTPNKNGAEYGFVMARTDTAKAAAEYFKVPEADYRIQYNATNVNGKNTTNEFFYVQNLICSGYDDHRNYDGYRLYTSVVTYEGYEGEELTSVQSTPITARPYIRYYDANGLLRTYYNNYTGQSFSFGGCSADYTSVSQNEVFRTAYEN